VAGSSQPGLLERFLDRFRQQEAIWTMSEIHNLIERLVDAVPPDRQPQMLDLLSRLAAGDLATADEWRPYLPLFPGATAPPEAMLGLQALCFHPGLGPPCRRWVAAAVHTCRRRIEGSGVLPTTAPAGKGSEAAPADRSAESSPPAVKGL
jgi:hypothetical protein